jgi:hypothetical protein
MKKIALWLTATAAAIAMVIAYQLNAAGVGGRAGDDAKPPPAAVTSTAGAPVAGNPNRSDSDGANTDHVGKPGENK